MKLSLYKLNFSVGLQLEQAARRGIGISLLFKLKETALQDEQWIKRSNLINKGISRDLWEAPKP